MSAQKDSIYVQVSQDILAVLDGEDNLVAKMATVSCLLSKALPYYYWTGFYLTDPVKKDELVIGPYQGTLGCLRIPFGKGVCGVAASTGKTQVVADVHEFPGHIACDALSRSEIVVPVKDEKGKVIAVLDVDSSEPAAFDEVDRKHLEDLINRIFI